MPDNTATNVQLASLEQRVHGLESGVSQIAANLSDLGKQIRDRDRTPWGVIGTFAGLAMTILIAIGGLAYRPVDAAQTRLEVQMARMEIEHKAVAKEFKEDLIRLDKDTPNRNEYDRGRLTNDKNLERLERRLDRLEYTKP